MNEQAQELQDLLSACIQQLVATDSSSIMNWQQMSLDAGTEIQIDQLYKLLDETIKEVLQ